jgi:lactoylglutathione lyase
MAVNLTYTIKFVAAMDHAVHFYRDTLGLPLKFQSPEWSEFVTGDTALALHLASTQHAAGTVELGFGVPDLQAFLAELTAHGVTITRPPTAEGGTLIAQFRDSEGAECSVSEQ